MQTEQVQQTENGVGLVRINGQSLWALWVYEYAHESMGLGDRDGKGLPHRDQSWRIRLRIDDFEALGVRECEPVRVKLPRRGEEGAYLTGRRTTPPFVWLELGKDMRR